MRRSVAVGLLGALTGVTASAYAFIMYMVNGLDGAGNPYAGSIDHYVAAFILAIIAGVGATLLPRRTLLGSTLLIAGSILGFVATVGTSMFNSWYFLAVPLCVLASAVRTRHALLSIPLCTSVALVVFGGWGSVLVFVALLMTAVAVRFRRPVLLPR